MARRGTRWVAVKALQHSLCGALIRQPTGAADDDFNPDNNFRHQCHNVHMLNAATLIRRQEQDAAFVLGSVTMFASVELERQKSKNRSEPLASKSISRTGVVRFFIFINILDKTSAVFAVFPHMTHIDPSDLEISNSSSLPHTIYLDFPSFTQFSFTHIIYLRFR